jgi:hypothetical protein
MAPNRTNAALIPAENYPPLLPPAKRKQALETLRSDETLAAANNLVALRADELRDAVHALSRELKAAAKARDWPSLYAASHEIRGLAGNAGLGPTGQMANGFCLYLDAVSEHDLSPEGSVVRLHVDAITRSVQTGDETSRHGEAVTQNLSALVARKLARIKDSETPR